MGTGDLLDEIVKQVERQRRRNAKNKLSAPSDPVMGAAAETTTNELELVAYTEKPDYKVCLLGKPNVGKSSLTNRILGTERMIVSNVAGTTRDAIDSYFENEQGKYVFIDTAGMRKKSKVDDVIERYSVLRATMAIDRADVCLIMIDAQEGVTEQDTKVAGLAHEAGKACIIVVNKWDLVEKDGKTMDKMSDDIRRDYDVLLGELTQYNPELLDKERLLAVTKCDMLDEDLIAEMRGHLPEGVPSVFISSVSGLNIPRLKDMLWEALQR
jgi:small GTP-binding protein